MSDKINIAELRAAPTHRWGPYPWDESDASEPRVELTQRELLALVEAVGAAYTRNPCPMCGLFSNPPGQHLASCPGNRFDFADGSGR